MACEGSCSHKRAPALPLATREQTKYHFKQNKIQRHLPRGANTSDNNWNFVDEVLDVNAAGLIHASGIWTEVTHGKQSYEERGHFYMSSSQEATEPPLPSLAKEKKEGGEGKGSALSIYTWAGHEQVLLCTLVAPDPATLLCQYLGHPRAWTKTVGSGI